MATWRAVQMGWQNSGSSIREDVFVLESSTSWLVSGRLHIAETLITHMSKTSCSQDR